jgi:DNA-directed RNA polymerase specialized sigma24 family protein
MHRNATPKSVEVSFEITVLDPDAENNAVDHQPLTQISDALDELGKLAPGLAEVMDLKFFCGFPFVEIAASRKVSAPTVQRSWKRARIYLH